MIVQVSFGRSCPFREGFQMRNVIAIAAVAGVAAAANAQIGTAVSASGVNNFLSETITVSGGVYDGAGMLASWAPGDMFGISSRPTAVGAGLPFAMLDDSNGSFSGDTLGIIDANDNGFFFGQVDTVNGSNAGGSGAAEWTFDVAGFTDLSVSIDFAAMGDFESADAFDFTYSVDGSAFQSLFAGSVDDTTSQNYTLAGGAVVSLDDPALINGVALTNVFQTLTQSFADTGSVLTLRYEGGGDGGSEAFAFRNIEVNGVPTPGAAALAGLAGFAATRRRRG